MTVKDLLGYIRSNLSDEELDQPLYANGAPVQSVQVLTTGDGWEILFNPED